MTLPEQFDQLKQRHPGMLLLFRMGDFYETFRDDASVVADACGLTITTRQRPGECDMPMCCFRNKHLEYNLHKLLKLGNCVAICDEVPDGRS